MDQPDPSDEGTRAEALGRTIKLYRTAWDISRRDLAERSGLSYSYLAEIENGAKSPSSKALHLIATALGMSPADLLKASERLELVEVPLDEPAMVASPSEEFVVGCRVIHAKFGEGTVTALAGDGESAEATVQFDSVGRKELLLAYAPLVRV